MSELAVRVCTHCGEEKTVDQFGKRLGGYQSWCKACTNQAVKARNKERYNTDPGYRQKMLDDKANQTQAERMRATIAKSQAMQKRYGIKVEYDS